MSCSRCGQNNHAPRPAPIPSVVGRPGAIGNVNPSRPSTGVTGSGLSNNIIKSAITGLKYVPK